MNLLANPALDNVCCPCSLEITDRLLLRKRIHVVAAVNPVPIAQVSSHQSGSWQMMVEMRIVEVFLDVQLGVRAIGADIMRTTCYRAERKRSGGSSQDLENMATIFGRVDCLQLESAAVTRLLVCVTVLRVAQILVWSLVDRAVATHAFRIVASRLVNHAE